MDDSEAEFRYEEAALRIQRDGRRTIEASFNCRNAIATEAIRIPRDRLPSVYFGLSARSLGSAFTAPGKIAGEVVTGDFAGPWLLAERFLEALPHELGFRHSPCLCFAGELGSSSSGNFNEIVRIALE
ncbi:MAG: hypothetical protein ABSG41_04175 [Bryobacteraceae bacterium]